ncbi:hypothetical protein [Anatilimnocola floriformis]|uniref:hypothetical protein n=1 Tax=Anatilimnocola floriformis TaxID=2948575 RepID=UPI0020C1E4DD|nr:hypothetical protein [Anatilimnocola floriformis]
MLWHAAINTLLLAPRQTRNRGPCQAGLGGLRPFARLLATVGLWGVDDEHLQAGF